MSSIKSKIVRISKQKLVKATVIDVLNGRCSVRLSGRGAILTGLRFVGPTPKKGDSVFVDYESGVPVIKTSDYNGNNTIPVSATFSPINVAASVTPNAIPEKPVAHSHNILGQILTGFLAVNDIVDDEDTILEALEKLQGQIDESGGGIGPLTPLRIAITDDDGDLVVVDDFIFNLNDLAFVIGNTVKAGLSNGASSHTFLSGPGKSASHRLFTWQEGVSTRASRIKLFTAKGTPDASIEAVTTNTLLGLVQGAGFDGTDPFSDPDVSLEVRIIADEDFDSTSHGTRVEVWTTPNGSVTQAKAMTIGSDQLIRDKNGNLIRGMAVLDIAPTTSNVTAVVNTLHRIDLSGLTAERDCVIPAGEAIGDKIGLHITSGDDLYELIIKGDTGITIENQTAGVEWSRLFIYKEKVWLIKTSATNWDIMYDGRIPCRCVLTRTTSTANATHAADTDTKADWNAATDIGNIVDLSNDRVNIRRYGDYTSAGAYAAGAGISDLKYGNIVIYKNGTTRLHSVAARQSASGSSSIFGAGLSPKINMSLSPNDYLEYFFKTEEANRGLLATDYSGAGSAILAGISFFSIEEILR